MNRLSVAKQALVLKALNDGCSIRTTVRMTGVAKNTVLKLLVDAGRACADYQDGRLRNLPCQRVQCDEIWSFCHSKEKNVAPEHQGILGYGDVWTWTAIDADSKLMVSWLLGERNAECASSPTIGGAVAPTATIVRAAATSTPVPAPSNIAATSTAAAAGPGVEIVSLTSPVNAGGIATVTAKASPNTQCSIVVRYKSGPSTAAGLGTKTAGADGAVSWSWTVGQATTAGDWPVIVTCAGQSKTTTLTVR